MTPFAKALNNMVAMANSVEKDRPDAQVLVAGVGGRITVGDCRAVRHWLAARHAKQELDEAAADALAERAGR